jgi:DNA-binding NarL/FixJ family response regulator
MPARLVIFEDVIVVRDMLVEVFRSDAAYDVVGAFDDGAEGLEESLRLAPDVALVDYVLPGLDGLSVARRLMAALPAVKVVLVTAHDRDEVLLEAVSLGVHGVVTKGSPLLTLKEAVAQVLTTGTYYCPTTAGVLQRARDRTRVDPLTAREREVVALIAAGMSTKQVAHHLRLSEKTVTNHRSSLMKKLDVHDVATLTRYAVERGLVPSRGRA